MINKMWQGVVENRNDPLKLGRVQVRVFGIHSPEAVCDGLIGIKTENLQWAHVLSSPNNASMNGIGDSNNGLVKGSWVLGVYRDELKTEAIILGSFNGFNNKPNETVTTFQDDSNIYPKSDFLDEQDTNRLVRNDFDDNMKNICLNEDPDGVMGVEIEDSPDGEFHQKKARHKILTEKFENRELEIPIPTFEFQGDTTKWDESPSTYNAKYPHNKVFETECGHAKEWDSTPGSERIHEYHKSGTFYEIQEDGTKVTKIVGDDFEIIHGGKNLLIKGDVQVTIIGNSNVRIEGNVLQQVVGDIKQNIEGNVTTKINKDLIVESTEENVHVTAKKNITLIAQTEDITVNSESANVNVNAKKDVNVTCDNSFVTCERNADVTCTDAGITASDNIQMGAGGDITIDAGGSLSMTAGASAEVISGGQMTIDGASIHIG